MSKALLRRSQRLYSCLLKLYPKSYREEFGEEMKYVFSKLLEDEYKEGGRKGIYALLIRAIFDAGKSLVIQHVESLKGGEFMKTKRTDIIMLNKIFAWIGVLTGLILMIPLVAMQITGEVNWTLSDFVIMGALLFGTGFLFVHAARIIPRKYRVFVGLGFFAAVLLVWVHLSVGIFDAWPLAGY